MKKKVTVVGLGYIGLPTAIILAYSGHEVYGYDIDNKLINSLNKGEINHNEPGLYDLFKTTQTTNKIEFSSTLKIADIYIICVPTPFKQKVEEHISDLSCVEEASKQVGRYLKKGDLVILESTVPLSTTKKLMGKILEEASGLKIECDFSIAHCPERVMPGQLLNEMFNNDRIIGAEESSKEMVKDLYSSFLPSSKIHITNIITAEMSKLVENTFRFINISFANELSIICNNNGIDIYELINLANKHPRVNILHPSVGIGGHCIAVDPLFILEQNPKNSTLISAAKKINDNRTSWIIEQVINDINNKFKNNKITIGILGLAFKPDTEDIRLSKSIDIAQELIRMGFSVIACEPNVNDDNIEGIENVNFYKLIDKVDYIIYAVNHRFFKLKLIKEKISLKHFYDCTGEMQVQ